ncbi:hypothetical protein PTE30175_01775 [Pandoraea terrae]|uniref:Uncharacterized protein n=1 Tax=Pandoraea terrae TaxID=1537710 RepID=A0A5E4U6M0_9BURK|nr:hypothetical protein [Pandoraea terrae]VVD95391.1 hypothetical protein PTE30175_01775 [Pandoraea terrae]
MSDDATRVFGREMKEHSNAAKGVETPIAEGNFLSIQQRLDAASALYVARAKPIFSSLRDITGQVAGLLVLSSVGSVGVYDHPMIDKARLELGETTDCLGALSATAHTRHFHWHLTRSASWVDRAVRALDDARSRLKSGTPIHNALECIKRALTELKSAGQCLPGFEVVDISSACCSCCRSVTSDGEGIAGTFKQSFTEW